MVKLLHKLYQFSCRICLFQAVRYPRLTIFLLYTGSWLYFLLNPRKNREVKKVLLSYPYMKKFYNKRYIVSLYFQFVQHFLEIYAVYHKKSLNFMTLDYREEDIERFNSNPGIVLSAHLGNWELCGYWLSSRIQQKKFGILVGQSQSSFWQNVLCDNRKRWNIVPFFISDRFKSMYSFISEIREKKMVTGFFLDADYGKKTTMFPFLGKEQKYLDVPFSISSKYKIPVYTAFFLRRGLFSFEFILSQGIQVSNYHDTIIRDIYREIEEQILAHPNQWVWPLREVK